MDEKDSRTFECLVPEKTSMRDVDKKFDSGQEVTDFPGHSLAWHGTDDCVDQLCCDTIQRIKLYQRVFGKLGEKYALSFLRSWRIATRICKVKCDTRRYLDVE